MKYCQVCQESYPQEFLICPKDGIRLDDNSAESLVGLVLNGKYRLERHIASGGMASIYAATRLEIGDTVAVKILTPDALRNPMAVLRFRRESQAAARIKHPGVVSVYDFSTLPDGRTFMVMEFLKGQSLRDELTTCGRIAPERVLAVMEQVCAAMQSAHEAGIIHRDLKPENIMAQLNSDGTETFKVVDFGVAELREQAVGTALTKLTEAGMMVGTPYYMSPEQCRSQYLDARSDIYSLGIILYEMLTGTVPFASRTLSAVIIQQVTEPPRPLRDHRPEISPALERVVLKALAKECESRQQTASELAEELAQSISGRILLPELDDEQEFEEAVDFFSTFPTPPESNTPKPINSDDLTGAYTAGFFHYHVEETLTHAAQTGGEVALVAVRLQRLQQVNETFGFVAGDRMLRKVADWMRVLLRPATVIGRIGGSEFGVLFLASGTKSAAESAAQFTEACAAQVFAVEESDTEISLKTSVTLFPTESNHAFGLLAKGRKAVQVASHRPEDPASRHLRFEQFVGRALESEQLLHEFNLVKVGRGHPVFVSGAAGIGKTRLVQEFEWSLAGQDVLFLTTRFYEAGGSLPYRAFYESLRGVIGYFLEVAENRLPALFGPMTPQVIQDFSEGEWLTFASPSVQLSADQEKYRIFDYLTRLYLGVTRLRPVVLVIDDMHWADGLSLEFLAYLMRNSIGHRLFLIATMREREATSMDFPITGWLRQMSRSGNYVLLTLRPLDDASMQFVIEQTFGKEGIPPKVVATLLHEARGNPFYLREMLRLLVSDGAIKLERDHWVCDNIPEIRLPETIVDLVDAYLSGLDGQTLEVLTQAAAIGGEFTYEVLEAVTEMKESALLPILEKALKNAILQEHPSRREDRYVFAHATFRKVLYERLSKRRRKRLHLHIGNVMAQVYAERSSFIAAELARHYLAADDLEHALWYTIEAGNQSWSSLAISDAGRYYQQAEEIIERLGSAPLEGDTPVLQMAALGLQVEGMKLAEYHLNFGCMCIQQGKVEKARLELDQAFGFGKQLDSNSLMGRALTAMAELCHVLGDYATGMEHAADALDLLRQTGDNAGEIKALIAIAASHNFQGQYAQSRNVYEMVLDLAKAAGDRLSEAGALWGVGQSLYQQGHYESALKYGEQSLVITREIGDRLGERRSLSLIGGVHLDLGNYDEALKYFESALRVVRGVGYRVSEGAMLNNIGEAMRRQRRFTEALVYYQQSLELARETNDRGLQALVTLNIGLVQQGRGQHRQALEMFEQSLQEITYVGLWSLEYEAYICIGDSHLAIRNYAQARQAYETALQNCEVTGAKRHQWKALYGLAHCERNLGNAPTALRLLRETVASIEALAAGLTSYTDRNRFLKDLHRVYNDLAELAVELGEDI